MVQTGWKCSCTVEKTTFTFIIMLVVLSMFCHSGFYIFSFSFTWPMSQQRCIFVVESSKYRPITHDDELHIEMIACGFCTTQTQHVTFCTASHILLQRMSRSWKRKDVSTSKPNTVSSLNTSIHISDSLWCRLRFVQTSCFFLRSGHWMIARRWVPLTLAQYCGRSTNCRICYTEFVLNVF